jgi:hypothetical protein
MPEFILIAVPLLLVLYLSHGRLRGHIKALGDQLDAQREAQMKLRDANRELLAELRRLEARIESGSSKTPAPAVAEPAVAREPEEEVVKLRPQEQGTSPADVPDERVSPPPLPVRDETARVRAWLDARPASAGEGPPPAPARDDARPSGFPEGSGPSVLSRIPWREILKRMHLLPPSKSGADGTAESQLAAWWVIRIGLVLLIIAAVFFGIHVSQHTPPWLRVGTLVLVSLGTIGLGARMRDRLEGFGRAIIGGGFALLYFTAFAAFALPATKIITAPAAGVLAQLAALVAAIGWAMWRRDQTVATLTVFLGLVSCGFSHSHDLDRFASVGLVLLAATGSFLFASRGWLTPFITALVGTWAGFGGFAVLDCLRGDAPPFFHLMAALVVLAMVFETGGLACVVRGSHVPGDALRRWLILGNTAAAAVIGYPVVRLAHPDQLPEFYFISAALFFVFTVIRHLRTNDRAVTESLFLKSSAMLCLGFAAAFSGPVRWLAIAFQAFALLWTSRRSGSRWIAAGFVVVIAASIGWFWRDLLLDPPATWRWSDPFRIAGSLWLVFLTTQIALHGRWFPEGIGGGDARHRDQARGFRLLGLLAIGATALVLAFVPAFPGHADPAWFLFAVAVMIAVPAPLLRVAAPCLAAAIPLVSCYIAYACLPPFASRCDAGLLLGPVLVLAAFGVSVLLRRFRTVTPDGGEFIREIALLAGLATLLPLVIALGGRYQLEGEAGFVTFALFPLTACAAVRFRRRGPATDSHPDGSPLFHGLTGALVMAGGAFTCRDSEFFPMALALAGLPLLAMAARARAWMIAIGGGIPILGGFVTLWHTLLAGGTEGLADDVVNLTVLPAVSIGLAVVLWKKVNSSAWPGLAMGADVALHGLGVFSLHLFFQKHFGEGPDFLAAAVLGVVMLAISRRYPFRSLEAVSWLPVALACAWAFPSGIRQGVADGDMQMMAAGLLVLGHLVAANAKWRKDASGFRDIFATASSAIAVTAWILVVLAAAKEPWQAAALTGIALLASALWRWRAIANIGYLGLVPLALAFPASILLVMRDAIFDSPASHPLTSVLLTAAGFAANGMLMAATVRGALRRKITASSVLPWCHGLCGLIIAFSGCAADHLVNGRLTAVFWGISAILLFACGLFAGLRAYRLAGLIGLVFCTGRIFIFDIQDTFYRIIAFFVIGLVMLVIGFLYNRFRERISAMDAQGEAGDPA